MMQAPPQNFVGQPQQMVVPQQIQQVQQVQQRPQPVVAAQQQYVQPVQHQPLQNQVAA